VIASIAIVIARLRGLKFFYWLSWPEPESQLLRARQGSARYPKLAALRGRTYALLLYHWILPRSDHIFVQSERMKRDVCAHGARPEKVTPVPMGVDLSTVPPIGKAKRRDVEVGPQLVYLGVLAAERQLLVLVDMLALLRKQGVPATLTIVGDGNVPEERLALERRAQELGVQGYLEITGFMPRAEAFERVRSADIGLSPFYPTPILLSTSPTKLVEYLALGLPVVANDHPEQRLVLRETRAGVCVPWGAQHFARAVRWLMKRPPQEREAMGARGRAWVEANRTYARIADNLERTYTELLS
jgi:glycosyltransferase involved in cell wall biosynthesis